MQLRPQDLWHQKRLEIDMPHTEKGDMSHGLWQIQHHLDRVKLQYCFDNRGELHWFLPQRFGLVRAKAKAISEQIEKIKKVAESKGYDDITALLKEDLVYGDGNPDSWRHEWFAP